MKTLLQLGPKDHGRLLTDEEWEAAHLEKGHRYELIDGRLIVSPAPELPHFLLQRWLRICWEDYSRQHPDEVNLVAPEARVYVPGRPYLTVPEPDLTAYQNFPFDKPRRQQAWRLVSPVFVAEIVSEDNADKDLTRNVDLYLQIPSVREYWILDPRDELVRMLVYRRRGSRWQNIIEVIEGESYTSRLFPGLKVTLTPP